MVDNQTVSKINNKEKTKEKEVKIISLVQEQ
jgi:hypothetical protein